CRGPAHRSPELLPAARELRRRRLPCGPAVHHRRHLRWLVGGAVDALRRGRRVRPDHGEVAVRRSPLPGFGPTMGYTIVYLSLIVLIPLATLVVKTAELSPGELWTLATSRRALASYEVTFGASLIAALVNAALGTVVAWALVRYQFPGRAVLDAIVDIPFALPTAVSGLART